MLASKSSNYSYIICPRQAILNAKDNYLAIIILHENLATRSKEMNLERLSRSVSTDSSCSEETKRCLQGIGLGEHTGIRPKLEEEFCVKTGIHEAIKKASKSTNPTQMDEEDSDDTDTESFLTPSFPKTRCTRSGNRSSKLRRSRPNGGAGNRDRPIAKLARYTISLASGKPRYPGSPSWDDGFELEWLGKRRLLPPCTK
jgi:hypothetical protein